MKRVLVLLISLATGTLYGQEYHYTPPRDTAVIHKIEAWQDLKFGLLMHWGTYSQWGIVESWSICPEDEGWTQRKGPHSGTYNEYKTAYENLQSTFNPVRFNPEKWATAAHNAGMKYMIFTTKHHDGFSMFDTKETDYKITDPKTPFSKNPRANITKEVFNAFRSENFWVGAYFSKPDWHSPDYWWPYFPPKDRRVNYDPAKYPERWEKFKSFTYNQLQEILTGYGKVDILWLDGGWVRPNVKEDSLKGWQGTVRFNQDIDMPKIEAMARKNQPGIIVVDRAVPGEYENYTTPEQEVPEKPLNYPWETCMTLATSWSYVPHDKYKSVGEVVQLLVKIVSRGGNLLLNVGPGPDGEWDSMAYQRLEGIGKWIKVNGGGIYGSKPIAPYSAGNIFYTQSKNGKQVFAFVLPEKGKDLVSLTDHFEIPLSKEGKIKKVTLAGANASVKWRRTNTGITIDNAPQLNLQKLNYAACFTIEYQ